MGQRTSPSSSSSSSSPSEEDRDGLPSPPPPPVRRRKPPGRNKKSSWPQKRGLGLALSSGVLAAFAGTFGKLAMDEEEAVDVCDRFGHYLIRLSPSSAGDADVGGMCARTSLFLRVGAFVVMILLNAVMWTTFVKALRYCSTSLEATVTNTAANFLSSAIVGELLFEESVGAMWCMGTALIICGLLLMNYSGRTVGATSLKQRRKQFKSH